MHKGVKRINRRTFKDCISLKSITIPESVTAIETNAFDGCTSLKEITLPESVTELEEDSLNGYKKRALDECSALTAIYVPAGKAEFYYKSLSVKLHDKIVELEPEKR